MKLILTGHYAGATKDINGYKFVKGELLLKGDITKMDGLIAYMRTYNAFLAGSEELAEAQARDAATKGGSDGTDAILDGQGGASEGGAQANESSPGTGSGDGATGTSTDGSGSGAEGDGVQAGREADAKAQAASDPNVLKIIDALKSLDPTNDDHWTDAGLPLVGIIATASGIVNVTRKDISAALPGWNREMALANV